jgi:hypothetical protein
MELAFALQENPYRWFLREVAALRFCFYGPSTSKMSRVRARVGLPVNTVGNLSLDNENDRLRK